MRTYTREQVAQVVRETAQRYERSADAHMRAGEKRGEAFERGRVEGCHEVLRRLDALPSPLTPGNLPGVCGGCGVAGAVCSQCRKESQLSYWVGDGAESHVTPEALAAVDESRNPPAAPESSPTRSIAQGIADMTRHLPILPGVVPCDVKLAPRPRAATPTPEVPPYAKQDGTRRAALTRLHEGLDPLPTGALASNEPAPEVPALKAVVHARRANQYAMCGADYDGMHLSSAPADVTCPACPGKEVLPMTDEQARETLATAGISPARSAEGLAKCMAMVREAKTAAEPTAPEVVWTGDGVRVLADGKWEFWGQNIGIWLPATPGHEPQTDALARALADAKREARIAQVKADASYSKGREDGAESMRERAADFVLDTSIPIPIDFWQGTMKGLVAEFAKRLAERIRALPLEEP